MKKLLMALALFSPVFTQASSLTWYQTAANLKLNSNFLVFAEIQPRWIDGLQNSQATLIRGALLYSFNPQLRAGAGYAHTPVYLLKAKIENRIFQQLDWTPEKISTFEFASRTRFEQRFIEGSSLGVRFREKVQGNWMPSKFGAYLWDELFYTGSGYDQNRFSAGLRHRSDSILFEVGYLRVENNSGVMLNLQVFASVD